MSPQTTESRSASQRDARGRFTRNNDGGPGNPFGRRVAELRAILLRSATEENVQRLAQMLMEKAFAGDLAAAKLLLLYWVGKPKEVAEPDRMDVEEWKLACESSVPAGELNEKVLGMPITVGLASVPAVRKVREQEFAEAMRDPEKFYAQMDDERTPAELAEEEEMIREMRAARETSEVGADAPKPGRAPADEAPRGEPAACQSEPQERPSVAPANAKTGAGNPPSTNGGYRGGPARPSADSRPSRPAISRAG
jgi:hypothetical protein